ncbi:head-tail connector protein [Tenacibaculum sp. nBUS_03]|uniref:head-tail connector protein n=1 Tax=Tenacibaculum sp. nBUS_03 TaxID=3395320 RepID=UPI003EBE2FE9
MSMYIEIKEFEPSEIVSLSEVKSHLKIEPDFTEEDVLVQGYIDAAINHISGYLSRSVQDEQFEVLGSSFIDVLGFKFQTKKSIEGIWYLDNGEYKKLEEDLYALKNVDKFETIIEYLGDLPKLTNNSSKAVKLRVTCGFTKLPKSIKQAVLLLVSDFYEYRADRAKKLSNSTVTNLISSYRYYH